jgi:hypothetical protein
MKGIKPHEVPEESPGSPLFTGGRVRRQSLVTLEMGNDLNINIVNFSPGARNKTKCTFTPVTRCYSSPPEKASSPRKRPKGYHHRRYGTRPCRGKALAWGDPRLSFLPDCLDGEG